MLQIFLGVWVIAFFCLTILNHPKHHPKSSQTKTWQKIFADLPRCVDDRLLLPDHLGLASATASQRLLSARWLSPGNHRSPHPPHTKVDDFQNWFIVSNKFYQQLVLTINLQEKNSGNLNILTFPATTPCPTSSRTQRPPCSQYSPCSLSCAWNVLRFLFYLKLVVIRKKIQKS